jgi:hypothetical protein
MPDLGQTFGQARRPWAKGAVSLARTYAATVDAEAGWSRDGPAVRFLVLALNRAYPGQDITAGAIAIELSRQRPLRETALVAGQSPM